MASHAAENNRSQKKHTIREFSFFRNYNKEVRHLEIDYNTREREKQITKIVDDGGFKVRIFFVAASGFLASSYSLFAVDLLSIALFYVYPPCGKWGDPGLIFDELTLMGTIMGMLVMGHLADRSGRKRWYGAELAILLIATMGMVQSSAGFMMETEDAGHENAMDIYSWISWWRFLLGCGIGAEYPLSSVITAEWASTESRGIMLSAVFSMQSFGRLLSFAVSIAALKIASDNAVGVPGQVDTQQIVVDKVWRWTVGIALIPAALAIILRLTIPETPRYYASIMKDSRKGVQSAMRLYRHNEIKEAASTDPALSQELEETDTSYFAWYKAWWHYLVGPKQGWRPLAVISCLWAIMDVPWYGLTMDLSSALATLMHVQNDAAGHQEHSLQIFRRESELECIGKQKWNKDFWDKNNTIYNMIEQNALRSIVIVSIASVAGSIGSIMIIDFFRRKYILISTFILISILFAITGGTLIATEGGSHLPSVICYAILQFIFNLGPNTLIFVLAAEIFPTTYRGTSNGISAACGKLGAVLIRGVIAGTNNMEKSLGIRLLVLVPFMLASAWISRFLPEVQVMPKPGSIEEASGQTDRGVPSNPPNLAAWYPPSVPTDIEMRSRPSDVSSRVSSMDSSDAASIRTPRPGLFQRLKNIPLEDIAPNPASEQRGRRGSGANTGAH